MIDKKDISFVVQGIVNEHTYKVLKNLKKIFTESEIILSTWKDTIINENLIFDKLVLTNDPGTYVCMRNTEYYYNLDRQIISTREGIKKATRKYIFKLRSDLLIENKSFIDFYLENEIFKSDLTVFKQKILIGNIFTRDPLKMKSPILFHVGDFFYFGLKDDIYKLFDIPLSGEEIARYFLRMKNDNPIDKNVLFRYTPEQYIIIKNLQKLDKYKNIELEYHQEFNKVLYFLHLELIASNFILANFETLSICCLKYKNIRDKDLYSSKDFNNIIQSFRNNKLLKYKIKILFFNIRKTRRSISKFIKTNLNKTGVK